MALTKSVASVDEWAEVAQNTVREGATTDVSDCYAVELHIYCCISSTTAHTGTEIIVQVSSNTSGDEDWNVLTVFVGPTGTALSVALAGSEAAGQTELSVTNPVTNNMDNDGKFKFLEHTTVANSEIIFQTANSGDSSDTITVLDGLANAHSATSNIFDIDHATNQAVGMYVVSLPFGTNRCRVINDNTYDPDGSTVHTNCRITKVTAV